MRHLLLLFLLSPIAGVGACSGSRPGDDADAGSGGRVAPTGGRGAAGAAGSSGGAGGGAGAAGSSGAGGGDTASAEIQNIIATYQSWQPQSAIAVDISAQIFSLCRSPTAAEQAFTQSPHSRFQLRDWANPAAVTGMTAKGVGGFAVGATIVKEKFAAPPGGAFALAALGIMIKRAPGFDSTGGDWEFVYWNATAGVSRGRAQLPACTACHAGASATDFVFVDDTWRSANAP